MKILAGILISLYLGLTLFGLYQYKAHNRSWGVKLVVWLSGVVLLIGMGVQFGGWTLLAVWVGLGVCLAYFVGWRVIGTRFTGWRQHLVRGFAFALCVGPLAAMGYPQLEYLDWWLTVLPGTSFMGILKFFFYGLPGFFLVGAISFLVSAGQERWKRRRQEGPAIAMSRRARLGYGLILLTLLPCVNWYVAGMLDACECAQADKKRILTYIRWSRPGSLSAWYSDGWTPLHSAIYLRRAGVAKLLIRVGADVNAKDKDGETPLRFAAQRGYTEVAKMLLEAGAELNAKDNDGSPPMLLAAYNDDAELVKLLIKARAKVNAKDKNGWTPLHLAIRPGNTSIVKTLIQAGADANAKDKAGRTPLHWAVDWEVSLILCQIEVPKTLIEAGAQVNARDRAGETPLDLIERDPWRLKESVPYKEVIQLLRKHGARTGAELDAEAKQGKE